MSDMHLAQANYQDWGVHYVMGWHVVVRSAYLHGMNGQPPRTVYFAWRRRTGWTDWPEHLLGECDANGYPLAATTYQLAMAV